jgi:hypothetical protein
MMILALFTGVLGCDENAAESPDNSQAGAGGQAGAGNGDGDGDGDGDAGSGGIGGGGSGGQGGSSAEGGTGGGVQDGGPQTDGSSGEGGAGGSDAGDFDAGPIGSITFTSLYDDVFSQQAFGAGVSCANDYCHGATGSGGLSVSTKQGAYDSLVNAEGSANCGGEVRVVPGDPDASLLVQKITDPSCGERMPKDNEDSLSPETIGRIRAWIGAGAMND